MLAMSAKLVIRPYAPNDASAVAIVHVHTWQQAYRGIIDDDILDALEVNAYKKRWQDSYGRHNGDALRGTLVAVTNNEIFGFLSYGPARDANSQIPTEIYGINILKPYWGIGVGYALFDEARKKMRAFKERETYLWVLADNDHAKTAYDRWGGRNTGITKTITIGGQALVEQRFDFSL